jgi:hypothetical protein
MEQTNNKWIWLFQFGVGPLYHRFYVEGVNSHQALMTLRERHPELRPLKLRSVLLVAQPLEAFEDEPIDPRFGPNAEDTGFSVGLSMAEVFSYSEKDYELD